MMKLRTDTIFFRVAITLSVVWLVLSGIGAWRAYTSINVFDQFADLTECQYLVDNEKTQCEADRSKYALQDYNDARSEAIWNGLAFMIIPCLVILSVAGFWSDLSACVRKLIVGYWSWLRGSSKD